MQIPNGTAAVIIATAAVKAFAIGALAGGVIIGLCYKGYNDGKKERAQ